MPFTTFDRDNDEHGLGVNCAERYSGAWWYRACLESNLNGLYLNGIYVDQATGVEWFKWTGHFYSLPFTEMKMRPHN
jgi:ficolin